MHLLDRVFVPGAHAQLVAVGRGGVLIDTKSGIVFELNAVAREVWGLLAEGHAVSVICDRLSGRYAVERRTLEADVATLLTTLSERGLITAAPADANADAG